MFIQLFAALRQSPCKAPSIFLGPCKKLFLKMLQTFYTCAECQESIYNPICPSCLAREIEVWLNEKNKKSKKADKEIGNKILFEVKAYLGNGLEGGKCIICKRNSDFLCPYCFTKEVFDILKELKVSNGLLEDFFTHFNYDFDHTGYTKEAEEMNIL